MSGRSSKPTSGKKAGSASGKKGAKGGASAVVDPLVLATQQAAQLTEDVARLTQELDAERQERNRFQLERDRLNQFWDITKNELNELRAQNLNRDRQHEEAEERHQVDMKVYKQKVKHLLYEYQNNVALVQTTHEKALASEHEQQLQAESALKRENRALKLELKEFELAQEALVRHLKSGLASELSAARAQYDLEAKELYAVYEGRARVLREELEMKRKNEIHELETRKNGQINALMRNHDKAFAEIKNYYNDITLNNLALINSLKEQLEESNKKEERNEKMMADVTAENKRMAEPLNAALTECDSLKKKLANYDKDRTSLVNAKGQLKALSEKHRKLTWDYEILEQRFSQLEREKRELSEAFQQRLMEIQQRQGLRATILEQTVADADKQLDVSRTQLRELANLGLVGPAGPGGPAGATMTAPAQLSPTEGAHVAAILTRLESVVDEKNRRIERLEFDVAKLERGNEQLRRVYEAKLNEYAIPAEAFRVAQVGTTTGTATAAAGGPGGPGGAPPAAVTAATARAAIGAATSDAYGAVTPTKPGSASKSSFHALPPLPSKVQ
ncbi:hypothetical protein CXG81DRAFT_28611 [Caulochytrium protostelioides]|uniref:Growth arrest-specific protein 8 domain-containing protein n=1 Tax=Caulochytrium protostelioides TaxID=1555241 RepID=A0A4P9WYN1_9FUNG|nr:hypothetical protein CXG81DRAFT_28611 [Caulochytrium protostelioides]|eukprot:RKO98574.1 hypothetical protein CXG81DRAFT_28611 [Caulochytrium protostelioides]